MFLLKVDLLLAAHLLQAIERWQGECRRDGIWPPAGLDQLRATLANQVRASQNESTSPVSIELPHTGAVPLLLTYDHAADVLEVSRSTVQRLVRSGDLPAVKVAGAPRIRKADLDAYVAALSSTQKVDA